MSADLLTSQLSSDEHAARRDRLQRRVDGPILLMGVGLQPRNLPMNKLPFRQDSNFLYFTGCDLPGAAALLDEDGFTLFFPAPGADDALWHGASPTLDQIAARYGADRALDRSALRQTLARHPHLRTLAVADASQNREIGEWLGVPLDFGRAYGDEALVDAVIALRRAKSPAELDALRLAGAHTRVAFEAVMRGTRPGGHERTLNALFEGVLAARGLTTGYDTILTQQGEILHHHRHDLPLEAGRLILLDGGGELPSGYGVDITRTWPVSGHFTARQRAAYDAVLEAQRAAIRRCQIGTRFREVHDAACAVLAQFLVDEKLLRCDADHALQTGAHALFFPHGVGHHLGLDVHDLEAFGDRPSYPPDQGRPAAFGTQNLRLDLPLEPGWVVTVEPGFYVIPAVLHDPALLQTFGDVLDLERAASWVGFGGIRIEDDVHITPGGPELLTDVPKDPDALLERIGAGPSASALLCSGS